MEKLVAYVLTFFLAGIGFFPQTTQEVVFDMTPYQLYDNGSTQTAVALPGGEGYLHLGSYPGSLGPGTPSSDEQIVRTNAEGSVLWQYAIERTGDTERGYAHLLPLPDGSYATMDMITNESGQIYVFDPGTGLARVSEKLQVEELFYTSRGFLLVTRPSDAVLHIQLLDFDFNPVWDAETAHLSGMMMPYAMAEVDDGLVLLDSAWDKQAGPGMLLRKISLADGAPVWEARVRVRGWHPQCIIPDGAGGVLLFGYRESSTGGPNTGHAMRIDSHGIIVWETPLDIEHFYAQHVYVNSQGIHLILPRGGYAYGLSLDIDGHLTNIEARSIGDVAGPGTEFGINGMTLDEHGKPIISGYVYSHTGEFFPYTMPYEDIPLAPNAPSL